jgi:hypothetical protein
VSGLTFGLVWSTGGRSFICGAGSDSYHLPAMAVA